MISHRLFQSTCSDMYRAAEQSVRQAQSRTHPCLIRLAGLCLTLMFGAFTHPAGGQLLYDHTTFVAGLGSGPGIWTMPYSDLGATPPQYLERSIMLHTEGYAPMSDSLGYNQLVGRLGGFISAGGQHVLVAHSLGSLVSRGTYIDSVDLRPDIAAIITIAAPHQGAPLADNGAEAVRFFGDVQRRVNDGLTAANVTFEIKALFDPTGGRPLFIVFAAIVLVKTAGQQIDLGNLPDILKLPALPDLSPDSFTVRRLNQRTDDAVIPRANIYGTIPFPNAVFRIKSSSENDDAGLADAITKRNRGLFIFKACKYIGYATIVLSGQARRCSYAAKVLQRVDERWVAYVNGWDSNGRPRYVPFDGIVPNERSHYPSPNAIAFEARVDGVNHQNIYKTRLGLDQVSTAMGRIGMQPVGPPLPPPPPPPPPPYVCVPKLGGPVCPV